MGERLLENKIAVITGGTSAMGIGIAKVFLEKGAKIIIGDLDSEKLNKISSELSENGTADHIKALKLDLTSTDSIKDFLDKAEAAYGSLDILVNNAGVCIGSSIFDITESRFDLTFGVNVKGLFEISRQFAQKLISADRPGNIVNIASNAAKVCFEGMADYNASKAAVVNLTQSMAKELAKYHINVNAVCPGAVDTDMLKQCMLDTVNASDGAVTLEDCRKTWGPPQLGRLIQPYEVGRVVSFLASDEALIIRGQSISIDGGNTPY